MIIPDLNLLLYAYNPHTPQYGKARRWWEGTMQGDELIGLPNEICLGFVRIATHPSLGGATIDLGRARAVVEGWLGLPQARVLIPRPNHFQSVMDLLARTMGTGALVSDASLAVYAIHNRATLCSNDSDFARFPGLQWTNPLL